MFAVSKKLVTRLVTVTAVAAAAMAASTATKAQEMTQNQVDEQIRACGAIADTDERMDCFNSVVESLDEDSAGAAGASNDASVTAPSGAEPAAAAVVTESAVDDFGLEDQKATEAREKEEELAAQTQLESIHANIVTSNKSGLNHFVVVLDNDQIWEETDGSRRIGLPKVGLPVEIYRGKLGGYRMKIGNDNRIAWVRRLR